MPHTCSSLQCNKNNINFCEMDILNFIFTQDFWTRIKFLSISMCIIKLYRILWLNPGNTCTAKCKTLWMYDEFWKMLI